MGAGDIVDSALAKDGMYAYEKFLLQHGQPLEVLATNGRALSRADALRAVDLLEEARVPVLGGQVFFSKDAIFERAPAGWYAELPKGQSYEQFVSRTCIEGRAYISKFPEPLDAVPMFSLLPAEPEE